MKARLMYVIIDETAKCVLFLLKWHEFSTFPWPFLAVVELTWLSSATVTR